MLLSLSLLLLLGASEALAHVTLTKTVLSTTLTSQNCVTGYRKTKKNGAIPTSTVTSTKKIPKLSITYKSSVPVKTVTPRPSTSTVTVVNTSVITKTDPVVTDTFSTTSTVSTTLTSTTTLTAVDTITDTASTTVTSTTLIPTPTGYIPIYESSGETNYVDAAPPPPKVRSVGHPRGNLVYRDQRGASHYTANYPFSLMCTKIVQTQYNLEIIVIKPTSTVTLRPQTSAVTSTSIYVSTSTVVPRASTTLSFSITSTFSNLATAVTSTTTHTTSTVTFAPVATRYAACENYSLGPRVSSGNYAYYNNPLTNANFADVQTTYNVASGYDCCAACFETPNCRYSVFVTTGSGECDLILGTECPAGQPNGGTFYETTGTNVYNVVYANGPCGSVNYGGVVGA